ncbi:MULTISPECIES: hypothetical protein [unclassified Streptosporangium]|uniref:hypothetical protein n=1 Tax=unclassified Streptosporangium TaxID=2632669 RepID=UPI002E2E183F|nr:MULTISPECIES: hypothetical protein [unclassified Streptosporangium]
MSETARDVTAGRQRPELPPEANHYRRQYSYKNPNGYCGIGETGVTCPAGLTSGEV